MGGAHQWDFADTCCLNYPITRHCSISLTSTRRSRHHSHPHSPDARTSISPRLFFSPPRSRLSWPHSPSRATSFVRRCISLCLKLQENMPAIRAVLGRVGVIANSSLLLAASPIVHIHLRTATPSSSATLKAPNPTTPTPHGPLSCDIVGEERVCQDIVDEVFVQGVWTTRARRLHGQELVKARPSPRLTVTAALLPRIANAWPAS
ncbi:hypothetical protein V8E53_003041 [Lactarius tabidus]